MSETWNLSVGIISSIILTTIGFFLKRVITETDKLFREHQEKLKLLTESISELTKEQILIIERLGRLIKIDEKLAEYDKMIFRLNEHDKTHRQRYHDMGNHINGILATLHAHGIEPREIQIQKRQWKED